MYSFKKKHPVYERFGGNNIHFHLKVMSEEIWIVAWNKIETRRLLYLEKNQEMFRATTYSVLRKNMEKLKREQGKKVGTLTSFLPASFLASYKWYIRLRLNSMATVRNHGFPDYFITLTANAKWHEIQDNLQYKDPRNLANWTKDYNLKKNETSIHRPDLVARVFGRKMEEFENLLMKKHVLGVVVNLIYIVEWQKRGLPHLHSIVTIKDSHRTKSIREINKVVCAEIPDRDKNPVLYQTVLEYAIHGPCHRKCKLEKGKCPKRFPKLYRDITLQVSGQSNIIASFICALVGKEMCQM